MKQKWSKNQLGTEVGLAAIADASLMQRIGEGSQCAYCIMIAPTSLYEGKDVTHLIDWNSGKGPMTELMYARAMIYEIESRRICNGT